MRGKERYISPTRAPRANMDACFYNTSRKRSIYIKKIETVAGGEGKGRGNGRCACF